MFLMRMRREGYARTTARIYSVGSPATCNQYDVELVTSLSNDVKRYDTPDIRAVVADLERCGFKTID